MNIISKILQKRKDKKEAKRLKKERERDMKVKEIVESARFLMKNYSYREALLIIGVLNDQSLLLAYMFLRGEEQ
jgi:hypothetical protein